VGELGSCGVAAGFAGFLVKLLPEDFQPLAISSTCLTAWLASSVAELVDLIERAIELMN
jgi:hypothetical protein